MDSLDPVLLKAIKLLHSSSKSSTEQLKCMLEEALAQRKVSLKAPIRVDGKRECPKPASEKRAFEKVKLKPESIDVPVVEKKMRLLPEALLANRSRSLSSSPDPNSKPLVLPPAKAVETAARTEQDDSEATDIEEEGEDESFPLEGSEFGDLACVVCKNMDCKTGNTLVECQECHSLYHQSCHKPPATDADVLDPRTIWNCSKCTKNMKKSSFKLAKSASSSTKPQTTASSAFQVAVNIGKESALQLVKERSMKQQQQLLQQQQQPETPTAANAQPFRRCESKPGPGLAAGTAKPIGLAGLAALTNLNNKAASTSSTQHLRSPSPSASSSSLTSAVQVGATSTAAADKRLQMMRKKAAKANEKKRSGSK